MPTFDSAAPASGPGDLQAVIDVAQEAVRPAVLEIGRVHAVRDRDGGTKLIDLSGDDYRDAPARKAGTTTVRDVPSFCSYFDKHADPDSEVYADVTRLAVTAVLDAHTADAARFADHRLVLALRTTPAWEAWQGGSGRLMEQEAFAEFLEDHLADIVDPEAAHMLEVAQSIQGATRAEFKSATRLVDGQRQLAYVEETTAQAGRNGELLIPEVFKLGIKPFEGSEGYALTARLRYRIGRDNRLSMGYKIERPEDVLAAAFTDVLGELEQHLGEGRVLNGTPA